jgi:L-lysine 2,3-aminomutase
MQQTAGAISLYEVTEFEQEMRDMAAIIVDAARLLAEAMPLLRDIHGNAARLHALTERLVRWKARPTTSTQPAEAHLQAARAHRHADLPGAARDLQPS